MKNYIIIPLAIASVFSTNSIFAQSTANQRKAEKTPCNTMVTASVHHRKHINKGVVAHAKKHYGKAMAHHNVVKMQPAAPMQETVSVDDHYPVAIVSIKDGDVYVNDSLVATVKNPKCENHKIVINYIAPPPPPPAPAVTESIEHVKVNTYTGEKAEPMLGVLAADYDNGVVVDEVLPGGPACKAGISVGDVITKVNGQDIKNGGDLQSTISGLNVGDNVSVTVRDYDGTETRQVVLTKKDEPQSCGGCTRCGLDW